MLPVVLVLLVAASAFAAPSVQLSVRNINDVPRSNYNGNKVNGYLLENAFDAFDGGDANAYILMAQTLMQEIANSPNPDAQALAVGGAIGILSQRSNPIAGSTCAGAAVANAVAAGENAEGVARRYVQDMANALGLIAKSAANPNAYRNTVGPGEAGCAGAGRSFQLDGAWNRAIAQSPASIARDLDAEYCIAKRLLGAFDARTNNIATELTSTAMPPVLRAVRQALPALVEFLRELGNNGNAVAAASRAAQALTQSFGY